MLNLMTVRCGQCGHENNPEYHFCGMCGANLQVSPPVREEPPAERVRPMVSGPSFLGLADEPTRNADYLLEDEPRSGRWRVLVALSLLLVSCAFLVWRWRREGYPWEAVRGAALRATRAALSRPPAASSPAASSPEASPPAAESGPPAQPAAPTAPQEEHATTAPEKTEGQQQQQPAPESQAASTAGAAPQTKASGSAPAQPGGSSGAAEPAPKQSGEAAAKPEEASPAETQPVAKEKTAAAAKPISKTAQAKSEPAVPSTTYEDQLVADGEKYLYGNGVPRNCARAQKSFLAAAQRSSAKAESMLGAMYATGHCVTRDLPAAYRWFARALHQDPGNTRFARDLEILWKQMTAEERQIAVRSGQ